MKNKGFSLVEVLVTSIITSIVLLGMSSALVIGTKMSKDAIMNTRLTNNANRFVERMVNDILANADMKVDDISQGKGGNVIGETITIKNRQDQKAVTYEVYYNTATDPKKKNKIFRYVGESTDGTEMVMIHPAGQTIELEKPASGYVFNAGNGYQADIILTLVCKQDDKEVGRRVIKTAGITCRNFKKA